MKINGNHRTSIEITENQWWESAAWAEPLNYLFFFPVALPGPRLGAQGAIGEFIGGGRQPLSAAPRAPRALAALSPVAALPFLKLWKGAHLLPKPLVAVLGLRFSGLG